MWALLSKAQLHNHTSVHLLACGFSHAAIAQIIQADVFGEVAARVPERCILLLVVMGIGPGWGVRVRPYPYLAVWILGLGQGLKCRAKKALKGPKRQNVKPGGPQGPKCKKAIKIPKGPKVELGGPLRAPRAQK